MSWVRLWAKGGRGNPVTRDKWILWDGPENKGALHDMAEAFAENNPVFRHMESYNYGHDDPVEKLPEPVRAKLVADYRAQIREAEGMLKKLGAL